MDHLYHSFLRLPGVCNTSPGKNSVMKPSQTLVPWYLAVHDWMFIRPFIQEIGMSKNGAYSLFSHDRENDDTLW